MKDKQRITEKELSFYYDGLLEDERRQRVEDALADDPAARHLLDAYACYDQAMQPDLSDEEIDALLADNVTEIHQRLLQPMQRTESFWAFWFAPRTLAAACVLLILFSATLFQYEHMIPSTPVEEEQVVVTEAQRLAMQAMAEYARSALGKGVGMAAQQSGTLQETFSIIEQQQPGALLALGALRSTMDPLSAETPLAEDEKADSQPIRQLIQTGIQQIALGISLSILSLLSVF